MNYKPSIIAVFIAINIPKTYIRILVVFMGAVLLLNKTFTFSWQKMMAVGIFSAFNKALSGVGFGPVVTGCQIIS